MTTLNRLIRCFPAGSGLLLVAAALVRFLIFSADAQVLEMSDPLLGIPIRWGVLLAGVVELLAGLYCLFGRSATGPSLLAAWVLTNWAVYRAGCAWSGFSPRCTCLGVLTDPLHLARTVPGLLLEYLPLFLLACSWLVALLAWQRDPRRGPVTFRKVACPGCGGHIAFPVGALAQKIGCPHCGGGLYPRNLPQLP